MRSRYVFALKAAAVVGLAGLFALLLFVVIDSAENYQQAQEAQRKYQQDQAALIEGLARRVTDLEKEKQALSTTAEAAKAQANTSVDQLVRAGEDPIISAPGVITVPTDPHPTTTAPPPPPIVIAPPAEAPSTTEPLPDPTTTTTQATTTTSQPESTTTTVISTTTTSEENP